MPTAAVKVSRRQHIQNVAPVIPKLTTRLSFLDQEGKHPVYHLMHQLPRTDTDS